MNTNDDGGLTPPEGTPHPGTSQPAGSQPDNPQDRSPEPEDRSPEDSSPDLSPEHRHQPPEDGPGRGRPGGPPVRPLAALGPDIRGQELPPARYEGTIPFSDAVLARHGGVVLRPAEVTRLP